MSRTTSAGVWATAGHIETFRGTHMKLYRTASVAVLFATSTACALGALTSPASASVTTFRERISFDPTGMVFSCQSADLTVTGGIVTESLEGVQDAQGTTHLTYTIVPHDATLTDGTNTYRLSGSSPSAATIGPDGAVVVTDPTHFVIRDSSGGVYRVVQVVAHLSPNGHSFVFDRGSCETPSD